MLTRGKAIEKFDGLGLISVPVISLVHVIVLVSRLDSGSPLIGKNKKAYMGRRRKPKESIDRVFFPLVLKF